MTTKPWYSSYVLVVVGLVSVLNYYDRTLLTILVERIKRDLHVTDGQVGLLAGFGFALMYSVLGVPMARIADRWGRARVLAAVVAVWSVATALSGAAGGFGAMLLARAGVGVGEAGGLPSVHALIADYFSPRLRGRALATTGICGALGLSAALGVGGFIADRWGWRAAFYAAGAPGLVMALVVLFTVREPPRGAGRDGAAPAAVSVAAAFRMLWRRKAFVLLCLGMGLAAIGAYAHQTWAPALLMRRFGLTAGQVGASYSAATGPAMLVSVLCGGFVNDWLDRRDRRWPLWLLALSFGFNLPASLAFYMTDSFPLAIGLSVVSTLVGSLWIGPSYALVQSLAGPQLRALAAAVFMMIVNIIGLGLGPYLAGALSDALAPHFGARSLMLSLSLITAASTLSVAIFLAGAKTLRADIAEADAGGAAPAETPDLAASNLVA